MSGDRPQPRRRLRRAARWLVDRWDKSPWMFNAGGAVLAMVVGMATGIDRIPERNILTLIWGLTGLLAALLLVAGPYYLAKRAERINDLHCRINRLESEKEQIDQARVRDSADLRNVLDSVGRELLRECSLEAEDTRISVYQHHGYEKKFALVGRTSSNPTLSGQGRSVYPDDVGIIAKAWQEQTAHDSIWFTDAEKWADYQGRTHGMDRKTARGIKMKSLSYLGVRIDDGDRPVGILVMESTNRNRITVEHADTVRTHPQFGRLQLMLRAAPKLPLKDSLVGADQEGTS